MKEQNKSHRSLLLIGANQGDRFKSFAMCRIMLSVLCGRIKAVSDIYNTSPWGVTDQEEFINQAILIETKLSPTSLLAITQEIETKLGKNKLTHWGPRHIDIDIILYENFIVDKKDLTIPHPHMADRRFVLIPLDQIASDWTHPINKLSVREMLEQCTDGGSVNKIDRP